MEFKYYQIILEELKPLLTSRGFVIDEKDWEGNDFYITCLSSKFGLKIENYRGDLLATVFPIETPELEIALYNLLDYLGLEKAESNDRRYQKKSNVSEERYKNQILDLVGKMDKNFEAITDFFSSGVFLFKFSEVKNYVIEKHQNLFKRL
jgi:hypothetical protein